MADALPTEWGPPSEQDAHVVALVQKGLKRCEPICGWLALLIACIGSGVAFWNNEGSKHIVGFFGPIFLVVPGLLAYFAGNTVAEWLFRQGRSFQAAGGIAAKTLRFARTNKDYWQQLTWRDLELRVAALFIRLGYRARATPGSGDKGVDAVAERTNEKIVVQCKQYANPAQRSLVSELLGVMVAEWGTRGILICTGGVSRGAEDYAAENGVELWDLDDLVTHANKDGWS